MSIISSSRPHTAGKFREKQLQPRISRSGDKTSFLIGQRLARPIFGKDGDSPYPPALLEVGSPTKGADRERGGLERRRRTGRGALAQAER